MINRNYNKGKKLLQVGTVVYSLIFRLDSAMINGYGLMSFDSGGVQQDEYRGTNRQD